MKKFCSLFLCLCVFCLILPFGVTAEETSPSSPYLMPEGKEGRENLLCDGDYRTFVTVRRNLSLTFTPEASSGTILLEWFSLPGSYTLEFLDASGAVLDSQSRKPASYHEYIELGDAKALRISSKALLEIAELRLARVDEAAFTAGYAPCDVLLLLKEPGGECTTAAPVLQYLLDHGLTVQICYVLTSHRDRMGEAMDSLRYLEVLREPIFLSMKKPRDDTYDAAFNLWLRKELRAAVKTLLVLNPKIVIADDSGASAYVLETLLKQDIAPEKVYAMDANGDVSFTLEAENRIAMEAALSLHQSQRIYRLQPSDVSTLRSLQGAGGALLEGLDTGSFITFATPTPAPTDTPSPAPTDTPVPTNTPVPIEETPAPSPEPEEDKASFSPTWILVPVFLVIGIAILVLLLRWKKK